MPTKSKVKNLFFSVNGRADWHFIAVLVLVTFVFLTGGGARADISSLIFLRPFAVALAVAALVQMSGRDFRRHAPIFVVIALCVALALFQLIPLPPALWHSLPGRELLVVSDASVSLENIWRPITISPQDTWNAFYSLSVPLAALCWLTLLDREQKLRLMLALIAIAFASGLLGVVQILGNPAGPAYLYRVTNNGAATGLFANKNHQALFLSCAIPMLAAYASSTRGAAPQVKLRLAISIAGSIAFVPMILATGSRLGLIVCVLGFLSFLWVYRPPQGVADRRVFGGDRRPKFILAAVGIVVAILVFAAFQSQALQRLWSTDLIDELRYALIAPVLACIRAYFPWGSGLGTFDPAFKIYEPNSFLSPFYINHAHNDLFETVMTGGVLGALLLLAVVLLVIRWAMPHFRNTSSNRRDLAFGRAGFVIIILLAIGSLVDYPLRVPSMEILFVIALVWLHDSFLRLGLSEA